MVVVVDNETLVSLWLPAGTISKRTVPLVEDQPRPWLEGEWKLVDGAWDRNTIVFMVPGQWRATWVWWTASWDFLGWYVNLEEPFWRTPLGFDSRDLQLDIVVDARFQAGRVREALPDRTLAPPRLPALARGAGCARAGRALASAESARRAAPRGALRGEGAAADFLVSNLEDVDESAHYAIMFLYRHSLELKLKEHIFKLDQHLDRDCPGNLSEHDLVVLWDEYLAKRDAAIERLGLDRDEAGEQDAPMAERLGELRGLDRKCAGLRYPLERDRSSSTQGILGEQSAAVVDLEQFGMAVEAMTMVLDGTGDWL